MTKIASLIHTYIDTYKRPELTVLVNVPAVVFLDSLFFNTFEN